MSCRGGGQEIDSGEAGIQEWFDSLRRRFKHWNVYTSKRINDNNYTWGRSWNEMLQDLNVNYNEDLHLASSMRSFRNKYASAFIETLLQADIPRAQMYYQKLSIQKQKYPIYISSFPVFLNCSRESREVPEFIVPTLIEKNTNFFG